MKLFYDHLIIEIDDVYTQIEALKIEPKNRKQLVKLVDETVHNTVLDTILSHLGKEDHEKFLHLFHASPHDPKHLVFLKTKSEKIEQKILDAIRELKDYFLNELKSELND